MLRKDRLNACKSNKNKEQIIQLFRLTQALERARKINIKLATKIRVVIDSYILKEITYSEAFKQVQQLLNVKITFTR